MIINDFTKYFRKLYNVACEKQSFFQPALFNIIGFYTDDELGKSLSIKINKGYRLYYSLREDDSFRVANTISTKHAILNEKSLSVKKTDTQDIVSAVLLSLKDKGKLPSKGINLLYTSDFKAKSFHLASVIILTAKAFNQIYKLNLSSVELMNLYMEIQATYFPDNLSKHEIFLAAADFDKQLAYFDNSDFQLVPLSPEINSILFIEQDSSIDNSTQYRTKLSENVLYLKAICDKHNISLNELLNSNIFEQFKSDLTDETLEKRLRYVIYELQRVSYALEFLVNDDYQAFGQLINQSHVSQQRDFDNQTKSTKAVIDKIWKEKNLLALKNINYGLSSNAFLLFREKGTETTVNIKDKDVHSMVVEIY